ncbi:uncharacterized protein LOC124492204 isoform X1 [Dermatophagoides farinae]|uniref:uncharacterized protein LOC124492204 isoform X1 n=1 Tax=Dermatophagoides farinae TaxID=6954 RepID=UPI003F605599
MPCNYSKNDHDYNADDDDDVDFDDENFDGHNRLRNYYSLSLLYNSHHHRFQSKNMKKIFGYNTWQWLYFLIASAQLITIFVLTLLNLKELIDLKELMSSSFVVNATILIICVISISFLACGIFGFKQNEICLFLLAMSLCCFYIAIEFAFTVQYNSTIKLARLCIALSLTSILLISSKTVAIYSEEYSIIGVSPTLLSMYKLQCFFLVLLKFDFLCAVSFALFNIGVPRDEPSWQFIAMSIFILISIIHWIIGRYAVIKEIQSFLLVFITISTLSLLWIPLQLVTLETCFRFDHCINSILLLSYGSLVSALILIIVRIWMFMQLLKVYKNFGYGLADSAFIGLVSETTRLLMRSSTYRQSIDCL